jgi:hypothetical protein
MSNNETAQIIFHEQDAAAPAAPVVVGEAVANTPAASAATIDTADLEALIVASEKKLTELKAQNFVADSNRREQQTIDAAVAALAQMDATIERFEKLSAEALQQIDVAAELQLNGSSTGMFGAPLPPKQTAVAAAAAYGGLRFSLAQHRQSRARMQGRLDDLLRVQSQHLVRPT